MTFTNLFGLLLNFSTSWKSCVKEQWPKKYFFFILTKCHDLLLEAKQRVEYFWVPEIMTDDWVRKGQTKLGRYSLFGKQIKSLSIYQSKLNFWNRLDPKIAFLYHCWHKQPPDDQTIQFWHQVSKQFWKIWQTRFFWRKFKGGQNFLFTVRGFYNEREYSGADWLNLLLSKF